MGIPERGPIRLQAVDKALTVSEDYTFTIPTYGVITASDEGLNVIARHDGKKVDKLPDGIMRYPNELAGSDRSAFCPIDSPAWKFRLDIKNAFGDTHIESHREDIETESQRAINTLLPPETEEIDPFEFSRQLLLGASEGIMFGLSLSPEQLRKITQAYGSFNRYFVDSVITHGFSDRGRSPRLSYRSLFNKNSANADQSQVDFLGKLSGAIFQGRQTALNRNLAIIADHTKDAWESAQEKGSPIVDQYRARAKSLGLTEEDILIELTNIIGAAISSPASFLSFGLSVYSRLSPKEQKKIQLDSVYRRAFYHEVQRLYQPLPWFVRDFTSETELDNKTYKDGYFTFLTYSFNRRQDIWGEDASNFRPERFIENPNLARRLVFFGVGRRRCPAGKFGETIAATSFERIIDRFELNADGPLNVSVGDTLAPKGNVKLKYKAIAQSEIS